VAVLHKKEQMSSLDRKVEKKEKVQGSQDQPSSPQGEKEMAEALDEPKEIQNPKPEGRKKTKKPVEAPFVFVDPNSTETLSIRSSHSSFPD